MVAGLEEVTKGEIRIDIGVDTTRLHFFDLDTGLAIRS